MTGIYKIISPSKRIYIGQAINIFDRMIDYSNLINCNKQRRLYNSFLKYGVENHIFEIIEICGEQDLNYFERKWQDYYKVITKQGLNCRLQKCKDKSGILSEETKLKISTSKTGIKMKPEFGRQISLRLKGRCSGVNNNMYGKKHKLETIKKMKIAGGIGENHFNSGKKRSLETCEKLRQSRLKNGGYESNCKIVLDFETGIFYNSITEAAKAKNMNMKTLSGQLRGVHQNKTTLKYI